jgi:calcineurin-like phosphoesterase family protein
MPTTWVIPDTHFHHANIARYCGRPEDFTESIIGHWRKRVGPADLVIHLGDVIFSSAGSTLAEIMGQLPGTKVLVRGNHDGHPQEWWRERGFAIVVNEMVIGDVLFTHIPAKSLPAGCVMNVCGHVHNNPIDISIKHDALDFHPWHRVLALEEMGYSPRPLTEVVAGRWHRKDLTGGV